ncbi:MFS transporter [Mycobacterium riyadhense]|uniref:Multidrug export protein EmrB n=1 Tax=Mycobacterium riyadhense TaxID=486698 RepID=A0A653F355_9MYCO|nr:MFS transporter [Mycobacterium riyadhense]MCV7148533.1 MFS transporter [Mycobacterium riyadhense]VTP04060.1 Multidrug export protein EmrB [Mycobacterium riyadhense]
MTWATSRVAADNYSGNPWQVLWAMMIGFFMIMLDSTIVAVANPTIMAKLHTGYDTVVWMTSAYLLGYAVLLLVAGRLGDRFGTKYLYLVGLVVFTVSSVWCGLSGSAGMLIAARVLQGLGAGLLTPQTLSTITQIFPAERRGAAMAVWGATAGVASLVGPLAGGALVDSLGWEWIFFVNVPVGIVGLGLAVWLIPVLPTHVRRFDWIGVVLSGTGMFLIVFALQQGQSAHWQPWIWAVLVAGVGFMSVFIHWQALNRHEPLIPLDIFGDRNFSLCNVGVVVISFATTAMMLPLTFYAQAVCGLSATRSALLIAPMAITSGLLAPVVGVLIDRSHPLPVLGFGFSVLAIGLTWLSFETDPGTPIWRLVLPFSAIGVAMAFVWSPLTATATRNLPPDRAGSSSGVFNATRQLGAVLGSAGMAAFMTSRIAAEMPAGASAVAGPPDDATAEGGTSVQLPEFVRQPFSDAMAQSTLLPAFIALFGIVAALFLVGLTGSRMMRDPVPAEGYDYDSDDDDDFDDDDYVEYVLRRDRPAYQEPDDSLSA